MEHRSLSSLLKPNAEYGIGIIPKPAAEDILSEKESEAEERRAEAKAWRDQEPKFKRLKRLALDLGIQKVIVSSNSTSQDMGNYVRCGWEVDFLSVSMSSQDGGLREWNLSKEQVRSVNRREAPVILIDYRGCFEIEDGHFRTLAHEIGHHLEHIARLTEQEKDRPTTKTMRGLFSETALHKCCSEINAECFMEYLTSSAVRRGVERHLRPILCRIRVHNPNAATLMESYRKHRKTVHGFVDKK